MEYGSMRWLVEYKKANRPMKEEEQKLVEEISRLAAQVPYEIKYMLLGVCQGAAGMKGLYHDKLQL